MSESETFGSVVEGKVKQKNYIGVKMSGGGLEVEIGPYRDNGLGRVRMTLGILKWNRLRAARAAELGEEFPTDAPQHMREINWRKVWEG